MVREDRKEEERFKMKGKDRKTDKTLDTSRVKSVSNILPENLPAKTDKIIRYN